MQGALRGSPWSMRDFSTTGESGFWEDTGAGLRGSMTPCQLGTWPPCGPGGGEGTGRSPTHLLSSSILRNGAFSLATGKEEGTHRKYQEARPCQSRRGAQSRNTCCPKVHLSIWETRGSHSHLSQPPPWEEEFHYWGQRLQGVRGPGMPSSRRTEEPPACGSWRL